MANEGHNLNKLKASIADAINGVKRLKVERTDINAEIAELRANMETLGIPKKAFDMAMTYMNMDPDKREGFDIAYAIVREAGGLPMSDDLFAAADRRMTQEEDNKKPEAATADVVQIVQIFRAEDEAMQGKTVHEADGKQLGAQN